MKVGVDDEGNWLNPAQTNIYTLKHKYWKTRLQEQEEESFKRQSVLSEGNLKVKVSITAGCKVGLGKKLGFKNFILFYRLC